MRRRAPGLTGLLAAVLWAAPPGLAGQDVAAPPAARTADDLAASVRAREEAFARTMADRDFEAFLSFISPEAVFFGREGALRGVEAIGAAWRPYFDGPEAPFAWTPDVVEVLDSGGLALTSGPVTLPDGSTAGRFNSIWRLDPDGVWRVVFDRGS